MPALSENKQHSDIAKSQFIGMDSDVAKVVKKFHQALVNKDRETVLSLLSEDVLIYEGGRVERSSNEYAHHHMQSDMAFSAAVPSKTLEHQVKVLGDTAISTSRSHRKGEYKERSINSSGMETMVLKKTTKGWKIIHIHWSN
nr:nuclear transport factor 2 family protein [Aliikangiella sp. G2MR2-5]